MKLLACLFTVLAFFLCVSSEMLACTTIIVSGKATADGRPMMFKNRDSDVRDNVYMYSTRGKYAYVGVVPLGDTEGKRVVYGQNEKGLAIMNSVSYNLHSADGKGYKGNIIRLGLEKCATVDEFEQMLRSYGTFASGSNYGCFDALGNCVYLECGFNGVHRYDANDEKTAPQGYIVRANFSMSVAPDEGKGFARYQAATTLIERAVKTKSVTPQTLMGFSRCLYHGLTQTDLNDWMPEDENQMSYQAFRDFIPRQSTASCVVMVGIKKGENPLLTTSWTAIAWPLTSVFVPICTLDAFPESMMRNHMGLCTQINWATALKNYVFPMKMGEGPDYIMLSRLINAQNTGVAQQVAEMEKEVVKRGTELIDGQRANGLGKNSWKDFYKWVDEYVNSQYEKIARSHKLI